MFKLCLSVDQLHHDIVPGLSPSRQDMQCTAALSPLVPGISWNAAHCHEQLQHEAKASPSFVLLPLGLSVSSVCPVLCRHLQLILMMMRRALWLMLAQGLCKAKLSNQSISTSSKNGHTSLLCHSTRAFGRLALSAGT